ncbi:hypothetical protein [Delftia phage PhiW-14]|uniref:Uncharacterized protein n=1 Tax=Delftia phage PhiW-14 TaxID=665032 RepID=C9DGD3_BPW14|nr:hypothetical protein DP-phiW-14_gp163 [Delftia phage PhiW-14]ACV50184.1 hypothetical protein [Delftia phage PhiW-14]
MKKNPTTTHDVVSDAELVEAFKGTNFGTDDVVFFREMLQASVLQQACGCSCGHTITGVMVELKLIGPNFHMPTKKGQRLMRLAFHKQLKKAG